MSEEKQRREIETPETPATGETEPTPSASLRRSAPTATIPGQTAHAEPLPVYPGVPPGGGPTIALPAGEIPDKPLDESDLDRGNTITRAITNVRQFLRSTRAGATALVGVLVTIMTLGGGALITEHLWLNNQQQILKNAANAATVAATLKMDDLLDSNEGISDVDLEATLREVAYRYIAGNLGNLGNERYEKAMETLVVTVTYDRDERTVLVTAQAELGGTLMAHRLGFLDDGDIGGTARAQTQAKSTIDPVEVVLAIDVSGSMDQRLDGRQACRGCDDNRMTIVKRAATNLVDTLGPNEDDRIAVGVVPWHTLVRLGPDTMREWETRGWAAYPARRVYAEPYVCYGAGCIAPAAVEQTVAATAPEPWKGCLDSHRMTLGDRASIPAIDQLFATPSNTRFAQAFFPATHGSAYECLAPPLPTDMDWQICFSGTSYYRGSTTGGAPYEPQYGCPDDNPAIAPLSTNADAIRHTINALAPVGNRTYSALGVLWGQRLLDHTWKGVWGGDVHPVDPGSRDNEDVRKALVLLTDGEDTHCGTGNVTCEGSRLGLSRTDACAAVKRAGTEIFVIAAMDPSQVSDRLGETLRECSSESDNPQGTYAFLNNSTPEELEAAFADIANQLRTVRMVY